MTRDVYAGLVLRELLFAPRTHVERRTESYVLPSRKMFQWNIEQQIRIPEIAGQSTPTSPLPLTVSLGLYEKSRTPDLIAKHGSSKVAVLPRRRRGQKIAMAMLDHYMAQVPYESANGRPIPAVYAMMKGAVDSGALDDIENAMVSTLTDVLQTVEDVVVSSETDGKAKAEKLEKRLNKEWPQLLNSTKYFDDPDQDFMEQLKALAGTTHLLAEVQALPGQAIILDVSYTALVGDHEDEMSGALPLAEPISNRLDRTVDKALSRNDHLLRKRLVPLHQALGLLPKKIAKPAHMADHCMSFYLLARPPDGMEIRRSYWSAVKFSASEDVPEPYYPPNLEAEGAVLSLHRSDRADCQGFPAVAVYELAITRHGWLRLVLLQVALILGLCALFAFGVVDSSTPNKTFIFGLPGTIAGAISLAKSEYTNTVAAWLRTFVVGLSLLSLGFVLGLSVDIADLPIVRVFPAPELYTATTAALATLSLVVIGWLSFGPAPSRHPSSKDTFEEVLPDIRIDEARSVAATVLGVVMAIAIWLPIFFFMP